MLIKTSNNLIAIEYFKHEGYHNVKCVSKELGYKNNRGTRRRGCIPEFLLFRGVRLVGEVWGTTKVDLNATKAHPILRWTAPQRFGSPSTIGFLQGGNRSLYNNDPGHNPQLDWGFPNSYNWPQRSSTTTKASRVQRPKSNKFTNFHFHESSWRAQPDAQKQWQEHKKCSSPSLSNPTTSN